MKTILTTITFAIAVMVFAFNTTPSYANEETNRKTKNAFTKPAEWVGCNLAGEGRPTEECNQEFKDAFSENEREEVQEFAYRIEAWCSKNQKLREAICTDNGFEWILKQFAGLTRRQKQQQDEDDWNAWILQQFAVYQNEDSESRDGLDGRDVADSGEEGSTSAAGVDEQ